MAQASGGYTRSQLVGVALNAGFELSERQISEWVRLGLLDRGQARGLGHARGKVTLWSENQKKLLLVLLRKQGTKMRAELCNLPVCLWLLGGEEFASLRQTRRCLMTWAGRHGRAGKGRAELIADQVVGDFRHPDADSTDVEWVRKLIIQSAATGLLTEANEQDLRERLARISDPKETGRARGPLGDIITTDAYVDIVLTSGRGLREIETASDAVMHRARSDYWNIGTSIDAHEDVERVDGRLQGPIELAIGGPTFEAIARRACMDLITLLGATAKSGDGFDS